MIATREPGQMGAGDAVVQLEGVTVIFLAQFFGIELTIWQQVMVMLVCILGGIGTAGVPAGSLPVVAMILVMVGVPAEGIAIGAQMRSISFDMMKRISALESETIAATVGEHGATEIARLDKNVPMGFMLMVEGRVPANSTLSM